LTQIYPLSLHDALPISDGRRESVGERSIGSLPVDAGSGRGSAPSGSAAEERCTNRLPSGQERITAVAPPAISRACRRAPVVGGRDRKSTRLNSSHVSIS